MKKNILFAGPSTRIKLEKCTSPFKNAEQLWEAGWYRTRWGNIAGCVLDIDVFTPEQQEIFDNLIRDLMDGSTIYVMPGWPGGGTFYSDLAITLLDCGYATDEQLVMFSQSTTKKKMMKYFEDNNIEFDEVYE